MCKGICQVRVCNCAYCEWCKVIAQAPANVRNTLYAVAAAEGVTVRTRDVLERIR